MHVETRCDKDTVGPTRLKKSGDHAQHPTCRVPKTVLVVMRYCDVAVETREAITHPIDTGEAPWKERSHALLEVILPMLSSR